MYDKDPDLDLCCNVAGCLQEISSCQQIATQRLEMLVRKVSIP